MKEPDWNCVSINCSSDLSETVSEILEGFGAQSVSTTVPDSDGRTDVTALFDSDNMDLDLLQERLKSANCGDDRFRFTQNILHGRDWVLDSQSRFEPILVNDTLWIKAPWHELDVAPKPVLTINPGMSFGTGHHETTHMCLEFLTNHILSDCEVVDFGCGSGILALAAVKLGARFAWGVDIDNDALDESTSNAELNGLSHRFLAVQTDSLPDDVSADVVMANLHLELLIEFADLFDSLISPDGWLVMSGILSSQTDLVSQAYNNKFDLHLRSIGNWSILYGHR